MKLKATKRQLLVPACVVLWAIVAKAGSSEVAFKYSQESVVSCKTAFMKNNSQILAATARAEKRIEDRNNSLETKAADEKKKKNG